VEPSAKVRWEELMSMSPFAPFTGHRLTALMIACGEGMSESVELLLDLGANVHASNSELFTPLHYAAGGFWRERQKHNLAIVRRLLVAGASPKARDSSGRLPVDLALSKDYQEIAKVLREAT
jgi:ankyrin repeat protein